MAMPWVDLERECRGDEGKDSNMDDHIDHIFQGFKERQAAQRPQFGSKKTGTTR